MASPTEIGNFLANLRERSGKRQANLARQLEWSGALLSRIESGERPAVQDEIETILKGIGTEEAVEALNDLSRVWNILPEPPLGDTDRDLLWEAEEVALQVDELAERPDVKQFFERRLVRYREELEAAAANVRNKRYRVALMGTIAVGKSTAICRAEGLELPTSKGMPKAVLETGGGGITICEVHLRRGPGYGVIVEPSSEEELRRYVAEFANFLINPATSVVDDDDDGGTEPGSPGISREVERALRNMAGLKRRRAERRPDGTVVPAFDEAREMARQFSDPKDLSVELLARMELHRRARRDMWHGELTGRPPLDWMQETFELINNGRHPEFGLPKRIELIIPLPVLGNDQVEVTLIDTQGVDDVVERADLEQHFDHSHTVVVLCSVFNEAPATTVRQLLTRARDAGVRTLTSHVAILVLPRPGDALAMKEDGVQVLSAEEGYDVKAGEIDLKLHPLGIGMLPVQFFNAAEEEPQILREFLHARIKVVQEEHRRELREIIDGAKMLLLNYEKEQSREIMRAAAHHLTTWLAHNADLKAPPSRRVKDSLVEATRSAHVKTIYASVIRDGEWANLDYGHQISHGARRVASWMAQQRLKGFQEVATNLLNDEQFADAHDLVQQTLRALESGFDALVRKVQLVGLNIYSDQMREDFEFWRDCQREWGRGRGYRERVAQRNSNWFESGEQTTADERVISIARQEWAASIEAAKALLAQD